MIGAGLVGALIAVVVTVIALNFVTGEQQLDRRLEHRYAIDDAQFRRELGTLLGPPIIGGNQITNLENGIEIFPAMLQAVAVARHSINFETYIYWSGDVGRKFADALSERARAGVQVHVLIDWLGSQKMEQELLDMMTEAGVHVERYHPLRWYHLARMNNRTHRKLLIVDGEVGFTGGVGITRVQFVDPICRRTEPCTSCIFRKSRRDEYLPIKRPCQQSTIRLKTTCWRLSRPRCRNGSSRICSPSTSGSGKSCTSPVIR
jgi:hypothetical protein